MKRGLLKVGAFTVYIYTFVVCVIANWHGAFLSSWGWWPGQKEGASERPQPFVLVWSLLDGQHIGWELERVGDSFQNWAFWLA